MNWINDNVLQYSNFTKEHALTSLKLECIIGLQLLQEDPDYKDDIRILEQGIKCITHWVRNNYTKQQLEKCFDVSDVQHGFSPTALKRLYEIYREQGFSQIQIKYGDCDIDIVNGIYEIVHRIRFLEIVCSVVSIHTMKLDRVFLDKMIKIEWDGMKKET